MRLEFRDLQKAQIYARDRAVCAFSGKGLWTLDYGISPTWEMDWVDHVKPAAKGGDNSIDNGVCASHFYNAKKRANSADRRFLFWHGRPTSDFFYFYETVPLEVADHLARFSSARDSDWFFNRSISRFIIGVATIRARRRGKTRKRGTHYWASASIKAADKWSRKGGSVEDLLERGLVPADLSPDQGALLKVAEIDTVEGLVAHMTVCSDWWESACDALNELGVATSEKELRGIRERHEYNQRLPQRVRELVVKNTKILERAYQDSTEEGI